MLLCDLFQKRSLDDLVCEFKVQLSSRFNCVNLVVLLFFLISAGSLGISRSCSLSFLLLFATYKSVQVELAL